MNKIKAAREKISLSQKRLAVMAGIDARTLRKAEKGEEVSSETYRAICLALNIPVHAQDPATSPLNRPWKLSDLIMIGCHPFIWLPVWALTLIVAIPAAIMTAPDTAITVKLTEAQAETSLADVGSILEHNPSVKWLSDPKLTIAGELTSVVYQAQLPPQHYAALSNAFRDVGLDAQVSQMR